MRGAARVPTMPMRNVTTTGTSAAGNSTQGLILRIQRMSTEDGPGIRSTVFFKGCPLACRWCHNPESISSKVQVHWVASRCIGCLECVRTCRSHALSPSAGGMVIDRDRCTGCLACTEACPSTALEAYGVRYRLDDLVNEVLKDRVYFERSSGGVTLSGGEPTLQPEFALALLAKLKAEGVHTALDTCGQASWEVLSRLLPFTDIVLFDLKEMDPDRHKAFTGVTNSLILENAQRVASSLRKNGRPSKMWVRTPLIPGHTARTDNVTELGSFIRRNLSGAVGRWDLCTFNNLCLHKYQGLGIDWPLGGVELMGRAEADAMLEAARGSGVDPGIVRLSGPLRLETGRDAPERPRAALGVVQGGKR